MTVASSLAGVDCRPFRNRACDLCVAASMATMTTDQITQALGPGILCVEITALDEATLRTAAQTIADLWPSPGIGPVWRTPGHDGVHARIWADLRPDADRSDAEPLLLDQAP